jgi:hypothetical protein
VTLLVEPNSGYFLSMLHFLFYNQSFVYYQMEHVRLGYEGI